MTDRNHPDPRSGGYRRDDLVAAQHERFGGMKFGSAFFGWLTATGMAVLLTALLSAIGAGVGVANDADAEQLADQAAQDAASVGIVGGIALAVVLFVAYFAGGYVAGRMARFDGAKQGIAVWLWAIIVAIVLAVLAAVAGSQFNLLTQVNGFPRIPVDEGTLTTGGIIALVVAAIVTLAGAILGGLAGMRYHRRVDHVDVDVDRRGDAV
jgi:MFS family permease